MTKSDRTIKAQKLSQKLLKNATFSDKAMLSLAQVILLQYKWVNFAV